MTGRNAKRKASTVGGVASPSAIFSPANANVTSPVSSQSSLQRDPVSMLLSAKRYIDFYKRDLYGQAKELRSLLRELTHAVQAVEDEAHKRHLSEMEEKMAEMLAQHTKDKLDLEVKLQVSQISESKLKDELAKLSEESDGNAALQLQEIECLRAECDVLRSKVASMHKDADEQHLCVICHEHPRTTIVLPCHHFQFCFTCILQHKQINGDNCPTCRGHIHGFCVSDTPRQQT